MSDARSQFSDGFELLCHGKLALHGLFFRYVEEDDSLVRASIERGVEEMAGYELRPSRSRPDHDLLRG